MWVQIRNFHNISNVDDLYYINQHYACIKQNKINSSVPNSFIFCGKVVKLRGNP